MKPLGSRIPLFLLTLSLPLWPSRLSAQTRTVVVPSGFGYASLAGESREILPSGGGSFFAYYSAKAVGLPNGAMVRELALRPPLYTHAATRRSFTVALGYPAPGIQPESMPLERARIVAGGLAGLTFVARDVVVSLPAYSPSGRVAPFLVKIPLSPFRFNASRGGLIVQVEGKRVGNDNGGYFVDMMKRDSDASAAATRFLNSNCRGSSGFSSSMKIFDARTWVPGGAATVYLQGFSTPQALLFLGTATGNRFPIVLNAAGMPGCTLWTLPEVWTPVRLVRFVRSFRNHAVLPLPNIAALTGAVLRMQALEIDPAANSRGLTTSSGFEVVLGKAGSRSFSARSIHRLTAQFPDLMASAEGAPILRLSY